MDMKGVVVKKELEILAKETEFYGRRLFHYRSDFVFSFLAADYYEIQKVINSYNALVKDFNEYCVGQKFGISIKDLEKQIKDSTPIPEVCSDLKEMNRRITVALTALNEHLGTDERKRKIEELRKELAGSNTDRIREIAEEILTLS